MSARRAPLASKWTDPLGYWLYLDRAGPTGLGGWIAPREALASARIDISCAGARFRARLGKDAEPLEGRPLYRFDCALPLPQRFFLSLAFDGRAISLFAAYRGGALAPLVLPAPPMARQANTKSHPPGRTLIVLAPIDWSFRQQRSQHLTRALSAHYARTLYLGPASLHLAGSGFEVDGVTLNLLGSAPDCDFSERVLSEEEASACANALRVEIGDAPVDVLVQFPSWGVVAAKLPGARIIYDCIDRHASLPHVAAPIEAAEDALAHEAALCLATSAPLLERLGALGARQIMLAPNATSHPRVDTWPSQRAPTIAYLGAIETWFDFELIEEVANAIPEARVQIIGQVNVTPPTGLPRNIVFAGEKDHAAATRALTRARVGIIPFKRGALTEAVNPVKAYEYLAAGLPVVMTPMGGPELAEAPGITVADTAQAFAAGVRAVYLNTTDADRLRFAHWAKGQTWSARADAIVERLKAL